MIIVDRPLNGQEKNKLNENYLVVINHYEKLLKRKFMRSELVILKLLVEMAYPAQINQTITRFYKLYPDKFTSFNYIYRPVKNMFKRKAR